MFRSLILSVVLAGTETWAPPRHRELRDGLRAALRLLEQFMMKALRQIGNFLRYGRSPGEHNLMDKRVREIVGVSSVETLVR